MNDPFLQAGLAGLTNDPVKIRKARQNLKLYLKNNLLSGDSYDEAEGMIENLTKLLEIIQK